ncbi:MAG: hypothetical protein ACW99U_20000 [Candidatus Thorarchaeota archaeon]|jgi:hypothetical protein
MKKRKYTLVLSCILVVSVVALSVTPAEAIQRFEWVTIPVTMHSQYQIGYYDSGTAHAEEDFWADNFQRIWYSYPQKIPSAAVGIKIKVRYARGHGIPWFTDESVKLGVKATAFGPDYGLLDALNFILYETHYPYNYLSLRTVYLYPDLDLCENRYVYIYYLTPIIDFTQDNWHLVSPELMVKMRVY